MEIKVRLTRSNVTKEEILIKIDSMDIPEEDRNILHELLTGEFVDGQVFNKGYATTLSTMIDLKLVYLEFEIDMEGQKCNYISSNGEGIFVPLLTNVKEIEF